MNTTLHSTKGSSAYTSSHEIPSLTLDNTQAVSFWDQTALSFTHIYNKV